MALIEHDCFVGNHCVTSSHVAVSGNVNIGDNTYIAPGVVIKEKINIGANSIIGMGAVVQRDIPDNVIALGNPARPMKYKDYGKVFKNRRETWLQERISLLQGVCKALGKKL